MKQIKPTQFPRPKLVSIKGELFGKGGKRISTKKMKRLLEG
jgi:hypothetical protein